MFSRALRTLKRIVTDFRVALDFPQFEQEQLQVHITEAGKRFDTELLRNEVSAIALRIAQAAELAFGARVRAHNQEIARLSRLVHDTRDTLALFERNYKAELDDLYERKRLLFEEKTTLGDELDELREEHNSARKAVDDAYQSLESAKRSITNWHNKSKRSPLFLGNAGNRLPKHSMFRQSFGDLHAHKSDRSSAASDIGPAKERVAEIRDRMSRNRDGRHAVKASLNAVFEQIAASKTTRQRMFDLRGQGIQPEFLRIALVELSGRLALERQRLHAAETERSASSAQMERELGLKALNDSIAAMDAEKVRFLQSFHAPDNREERMSAHRRQWLAKRSGQKLAT